eukprot:s1365_g3.t3
MLQLRWSRVVDTTSFSLGRPAGILLCDFGKLAVLLALRQLHAFVLRRQAENVTSALARWRRFRGRAVSAASVRSEWHDAGMLGTMRDEVLEFAAAPAPEALRGGACMVESCCASDLSEGPGEQTKREVDSSEELAVAWSSLALQNGLVSTQAPTSGRSSNTFPTTSVGEAPLAIGIGTQRSRHNEAPSAVGLGTQRSSYTEAPYALALGTSAPSSFEAAASLATSPREALGCWAPLALGCGTISSFHEAATSVATGPREAPLALGCGAISSFHEVSAAGVAHPSFSSSTLAVREAPSDFGIAAAPCQTQAPSDFGIAAVPCQTQAAQPAVTIGTRIHQGSTMEIVSCCGEGPTQAMEAPVAPLACAARTMPHALTKRASALQAAPVQTAHPLRQEGARWDVQNLVLQSDRHDPAAAALAAHSAEEVDALVRRIIGEVLCDERFVPEACDLWCDQILERSLKEISSLGRPFKYIATCVISKQTGRTLDTVMPDALAAHDTSVGPAWSCLREARDFRHAMGRERRKERKTKKEKGKDKKGRRGRGRRGKSEDSYYSDYSYYSYSETAAVEGEAVAVVVVSLHRDEGARVATSPPRGPEVLLGMVLHQTVGSSICSWAATRHKERLFTCVLVDRNSAEDTVALGEKARMHRDFAEADKIRDQLRDRGVEIMERERRWQHKDGRQGARPNADDKKRPED